jgi:hypothetical protein
MTFSWTSFTDVAFLTALAAGLVKVLDVIFKHVHSQKELSVTEEIQAMQTETTFRRTLLERIAALEAAEGEDSKRMQSLERKLTRVIGMLVLFRLCPNGNCPIVESLRKNGDIQWLDQEILDRNDNTKN